MNSELWILNCAVLSYELRIALFLLATAPCLLPTAFCLLPSAYLKTGSPLPRVSSENPAEADSVSLDKREKIGYNCTWGCGRNRIQESGGRRAGSRCQAHC
jgi:hypothetical protein